MKTKLLTLIVTLTLCSCITKNFTLVDKKPKNEQVYTTYNIHFTLGQDSLLIEKSKLTLDSIFNFMSSLSLLKIEIGAHTDFRGTDELNLLLSEKRANKLREYFISKGISPDRLTAKGYGETNPLRSKKNQEELGDNATNVNRRTTLKIIK
jgi:outer membrane protein OmpA-like peptidoglycan-associated protein